MLDKFRLDGQVALVTGAGSGLGQAMALALAEAGADVALLGRRKALVEEAAKQIGKRGRKALAAGA
ncbi:MAG: SDR family NAD(P)-dependent oxidoreductase, partial [Candidatus Tectomicrobia bacterium]|nr:SDR family NAD(P)-dependent oxidoreductase [Candidatus Tectomicrobia bacterium]